VTILEERFEASSPALSFDSVRTDPSESIIDDVLEDPKIPAALDVPEKLDVEPERPLTPVPVPEPEWSLMPVSAPEPEPEPEPEPQRSVVGRFGSSKKNLKKTRKLHSHPDPEPSVPGEPDFAF
jgi:hypothetical protein